MPMTGQLEFFCPRPTVVSGPMLAVLLERLGVSEVSSVMRSGFEPSWESFKKKLRHEQESVRSGVFEVVFGSLDNYGDEALGEHLSIAQAASLADSHSNLFMSIWKSEACRHLYEAAFAEVPESIRGHFVPSTLCVSTAPHDVFSGLEGPEGTYFGHSHFSVFFTGDGYPEMPAECRALIEALPIVHEIRRMVEESVGPVELRTFWNG